MAEPQEALPQFKHIRRYWDSSRHIFVAKILPGEVYVTKHHELVTTLLGSCIAVCMRDRFNKIGGMNHFKLPKPSADLDNEENTNYGIYAMELLINEILKNGGKRHHLECAIYGGGNVIKNISADIGGKNIAFVSHFLEEEKIPVVHKDVGHTAAQQVYYHPLSGNAFSVVKENMSMAELKKVEQEYMSAINKEMDKPSITYFD